MNRRRYNNGPNNVYYTRSIEADSENDNIFTFDTNACRIKDKCCQLRDATIVWKTQDIVHDCPYERIGEDQFNLIGKNIVRNVNKSMAFQITTKETVCQENMIIYRTVEGLLLSLNLTKVKIETKNTQLKTNNEILLAETDSNTINMIEVYKEFNRRTCLNAINILEVFSKMDDIFLKIKDIYGNTVILYSSHGQLYITNCQTIYELQTVENEKCYEFIPVKFQIKNSNMTGFLTQDNIIRPLSKELNCVDNQC